MRRRKSELNRRCHLSFNLRGLCCWKGWESSWCVFAKACAKSARTQSSLLTNLSFPINTGLPACKDCNEGYYSSAPGSFVCIPCGRGKFADRKGSTTCGQCKAGHYGDQTGATSANCVGSCAAGKYSEEGAMECLSCPEGRYGDAVGLDNALCSGVCADAEPGSTCCPRLVLVHGHDPGSLTHSSQPATALPKAVRRASARHGHRYRHRHHQTPTLHPHCLRPILARACWRLSRLLSCSLPLVG